MLHRGPGQGEHRYPLVRLEDSVRDMREGAKKGACSLWDRLKGQRPERDSGSHPSPTKDDSGRSCHQLPRLGIISRVPEVERGTWHRVRGSVPTR